MPISAPKPSSWLNFRGAGFNDMWEQIRAAFRQSISETGQGASYDLQELRRVLTVSQDNQTASFNEQIDVAVGDNEALVSMVTELEGQVNDPATGLSATFDIATTSFGMATTNASDIEAVAGQTTTLTASVTNINSTLVGYSPTATVQSAIEVKADESDLTAVADELTELSASVGTSLADARFRVETAANPSGATATIGLSVSATSGGAPPSTAALFLSTDGVHSYVYITADQFFVSDGTGAAALSQALEFIGGRLMVVNAAIANLDASTITTGTLNVQTLIVSGALTNSYVAQQSSGIGAPAVVYTELVSVGASVMNGATAIWASTNYSYGEPDPAAYNTAWQIRCNGTVFGSGVWYESTTQSTSRTVFAQIPAGTYAYGTALTISLWINPPAEQLSVTSSHLMVLTNH